MPPPELYINASLSNSNLASRNHFTPCRAVNFFTVFYQIMTLKSDSRSHKMPPGLYELQQMKGLSFEYHRESKAGMGREVSKSKAWLDYKRHLDDSVSDPFSSAGTVSG